MNKPIPEAPDHAKRAADAFHVNEFESMKEPLTEEQRRIACAERIGWVWYEEDHTMWWNAQWRNGVETLVPRGEDLTTRRRNKADILPNPEHSLDDALKLVEWMEKDGWVWQMQSSYKCTFFHAECLPTKYEASAPTFCAAIVLAFLSATAGEEKQTL